MPIRSRRTPAKSRSKPATVEGYLARLPDDQRAALQRLRRAILAAAPGAEECISYGLPAFRFRGRMLVWFGATATHCSFYPGGVVEACKAELEAFDTSKGTVRFQPDKPLPGTVVRKLVKARIAVNDNAAERARRR